MACGDIRHCPWCGGFYTEDDRLQEDVNICPGCGRDVADHPDQEEDDGQSLADRIV